MAKVTLTWQASTDAVAGYNVYRGTKKGVEDTKLTPSPIPGLSFVDTAPVEGQDFYVVKAVDASGVESLASNEATVLLLPAAPTQLVATLS